MNKIISVNIGGLVFPIDGAAYDKLDAYFKALRSKFEDTEGSEEIINDIELRIAEIFQERRKGENGAILSTDIEHMIETMGKPSEYDAYLEENLSSTPSDETDTDPFSESSFDEMAEAAAARTSAESTDEEPAYEDANDTKGTGSTGPRRFFRDPDDKWIGGVCAGFAAYIGVDPLIVRAVVLVLALGGVSIIFYPILWVLVPEAKTRADKMHMRGEKINIDTIEKNFRREFDDLKQRFDDLTGSQDDASKAGGSKKKVADSEDQASSKGLTLGGLITGIFTLFGKLIGFGVTIFVLYVLLNVLLGVFGGIFGGIFNGLVRTHHFSFFHFSDASDFLFSNSLQKALVAVGIVLLVLIPIIGIIFRLIKSLLGMKGKTRIANGMFTLFWLIGLGMVITAGILVGKEFREQASFKEHIPVKTEASTLYLDMLKPNVTYFSRDGRNETNIFIRNDSLYIENIELDIILAKGDSYDLYTVQRSRGRSRDQARRNAEDIHFDVKQRDSIVFLPTRYSTGDRTWRNQKIRLILEVPEGKRLIIDEKVDLILKHVDRSTFIADRDFFNTPLVMSSNGLEPLSN